MNMVDTGVIPSISEFEVSLTLFYTELVGTV